MTLSKDEPTFNSESNNRLTSNLSDKAAEPKSEQEENAQTIEDIEQDIRQDIDALEGVAIGYADQTNLNPDAKAAEEAEPAAKKKPSKISVIQTVKVVKQSGIVLGSTNQVNT